MMLKKNQSCLEVGKDWFSLVLHTVGHHLPVATGCKKMVGKGHQ